MAKILEVQEISLEWSDLDRLLYRPYKKPERSPGLHVTDILRKIAVELGRLSEEDKEDEVNLRVALGVGWEWVIAGLYPEMQWPVPELELDSIKGSPDAKSTGSYKGFKVIEEIKLTGRSLRVKGGKETDYRDIRREWLWMCQLMSYLKMAKTCYGRFHVGWEMGAYTYPLRPRYFTYLLEFDQAEIDSNWQMILTAKEDM